jgi:hypothetical protein
MRRLGKLNESKAVPGVIRVEKVARKSQQLATDQRPAEQWPNAGMPLSEFEARPVPTTRLGARPRHFARLGSCSRPGIHDLLGSIWEM